MRFLCSTLYNSLQRVSTRSGLSNKTENDCSVVDHDYDYEYDDAKNMSLEISICGWRVPLSTLLHCYNDQ